MDPDFVSGWQSVNIDNVNGRQSCVAAKKGSSSVNGNGATVNGKNYEFPFPPCTGASPMSSANGHGIGLAVAAAGIGMVAIF